LTLGFLVLFLVFFWGGNESGSVSFSVVTLIFTVCRFCSLHKRCCTFLCTSKLVCSVFKRAVVPACEARHL